MATRGRHPPAQPLHLAVERYVHCPMGGLVLLRRCESCALMQGWLQGERTEVLCAYPEPVPAIHRPVRVQVDRAPVPMEQASARRHRRGSLIFDDDWPEN